MMPAEEYEVLRCGEGATIEVELLKEYVSVQVFNPSGIPLERVHLIPDNLLEIACLYESRAMKPPTRKGSGPTATNEKDVNNFVSMADYHMGRMGYKHLAPDEVTQLIRHIFQVWAKSPTMQELLYGPTTNAK